MERLTVALSQPRPLFARPSRRPSLAILLLGCLVASVFIAPTVRADIPSEVDAVMQDKLLRRANVGVEVLRLGGKPDEQQEIFARAAEVPLTPASNLKIVTTSAALDRLGADFKFHTLLLRRGEDLVLVGDGDPTFGDGELLRRVKWDVTTVYQNWAQQLKQLGIGQVRDVVVDDAVFDEAFVHPHWPGGQWDFKYMAQVGGMNLNANLVEIVVQPGAAGGRVGVTLDPATRYVSIQNSCVTGTQNAISAARQEGTNAIALKGQTPGRGTARVAATIHDPPLYAATVLAETVAAGGVKVTGTVRRDRAARAEFAKARTAAPNNAIPAGWQVVGIHETPLAAVISRANKESINLYAESLCKRMGYETVKAAGGSGSWENGTAAVGEFLKHAGVPEAEFRLDDGCGLSRQDAVSPRALCKVLAYNHYGKNREVFADSLSIAGVDGTLGERFRGTGFEQRVRGKSGFIDGVSTLSGYLYGKDGQVYAFSIMMNGISPAKANSEAHRLQERILRAIDAAAR